jgi:hypothetical protein
MILDRRKLKLWEKPDPPLLYPSQIPQGLLLGLIPGPSGQKTDPNLLSHDMTHQSVTSCHHPALKYSPSILFSHVLPAPCAQISSKYLVLIYSPSTLFSYILPVPCSHIFSQFPVLIHSPRTLFSHILPLPWYQTPVVSFVDTTITRLHSRGIMNRLKYEKSTCIFPCCI